jgi:hypothetical protein
MEEDYHIQEDKYHMEFGLKDMARDTWPALLCKLHPDPAEKEETEPPRIFQ